MTPRHAILMSTLLAFGGCSYHVASPPASAVTLQSSRVLARGETAVAVTGGGHAEGAFGPTVAGGSARLRQGVGRRTELSAEATALGVRGSSEVGTHRGIYGLRLGAKWRPAAHLAILGGLGGGGHTAGGFLSGDAGGLVAYENRYFVPLLGVRGFLSQPVAATRVNLGEQSDRPETTLGVQIEPGGQIPLGRWDDASPGDVYGSVACSAPTTLMFGGSTDGDDTLFMFGIVCGAEVVF